MTKDIVAIALFGGLGTRLVPLVSAVNKHALPIATQPMCYYSIQKILETGITEIIAVVGMEKYSSIIDTLGMGSKFNCTIKYKLQEHPGGIAQALSLCKEEVDGRNILVLLGDNIFEDNLTSHVEEFLRNKEGCRLFLKETPNPEFFGVPSFNRQKRITKITEKPYLPQSNYAITGIYLYDNKVWDYIGKCKPSERGELEITDVNNFYVKDKRLTYTILENFWSDAGTLGSYLRTNKYYIEKALERGVIS